MKKKVFKKFTSALQILLILCFSNVVTIAQNCNCTEYLYLNEPEQSQTGPKIRKFEINENFNPATDPASALFGQEINPPWFDNAAANESLVDPHGLAIDLNGNIYVGEDNTVGSGVIRKIECDGTIVPASEFSINDQGYNFASEGNSLYVGTQDFDDNSPNYINAYDLCSGNLTGFYCLSGIEASRSDWGLYLDDNGLLYSTNDFRPEGSADDVPDNLFVINTNTTPLSAPGDANPTCINPFISQGANSPAVGSNAFARDQIFGVTTDINGNIYIIERTRAGEPDFPGGVADGAARILKYDSNGNLVAVTPYDGVEGDGGYFKAIGATYSKTLDLLLISTASQTDDCVSLFDTNLNYIGPVIPSPGDGSQSKALAIIEECCPTAQVATVDTVLCDPVIGEKIFILDLIGCSICEGEWTVDPLLNDFNFDDCDNSITINAVNECGSFNVASDGMGGKLCPAFSFTFNVCAAETPSAPAISITNNVCDPATAGSVNVDTPCPAGSTIEFSTDGGANWSTTQPAYDAASAITVRARCVNDFYAECISAETADVASAPQECCPPVNCINQFGEFTIIKNDP